MSVLKGGLILTDPTLFGFAPILEMLHSDSARIRLLTADSLKGFMFVLDVAESHSKYTTFRRLGGGKITSFIIKIVIITPVLNTRLTPYKNKSKKSESAESFISEARIQQKIWLRSIQGGRPEISPSVANLALFNNMDSPACIGHISSAQISSGDTRTNDCLTYLRSEISRSPDNSIGILIMPNIERSIPLGDYLDQIHDSKIPLENKDKIFSDTISNIVKLGIVDKVIHWDLHTENSLVVPHPLKSFIIDFGSASDLWERADDEYLSIAEKVPLLQSVTEFEREFIELSSSSTREDILF